MTPNGTSSTRDETVVDEDQLTEAPTGSSAEQSAPTGDPGGGDRSVGQPAGQGPVADQEPPDDGDEAGSSVAGAPAEEWLTGESPVAETIAEEIEDPVRRERDEYLDALRRLQAEFDNYRKRVTRQQAESIERATESLLARLLPVLDALDLALAHVEDDPEGETVSLERQALNQIASLLRDVIVREGLERIDEIGVAFDPTIHDAVMHLEREEADDQRGVVVVEVMRSGYRLKGKVVRPAMVQVRG